VHRLRAGDGSWRWFRTRGRAVDRDESGTPLRIIGAAMDISDQKHMEDQLIHGAKMQALGAFAGSVAHDFNNVMAIVRGHVELLRHPVSGAPPDPDETERRLAAIEQSVDRASSFVRQLMVLGRPEENRPADIDLARSCSISPRRWPSSSERTSLSRSTSPAATSPSASTPADSRRCC
jgi:two-component system, cell cycle sensor histidine kinase and response regulator CckA